MDTQIESPPSLLPAQRSANARPNSSALAATADLLRHYWLRVLLLSVVVTIPCFWHQRIEAGDLPSHVYNAWLAQLIGRGQLPGLWIARQWNNVLFDLALLKLGNLIGFAAAQKILVPICVLIFFWGAFALVCAMAQPPPAKQAVSASSPTPVHYPWLALPCLAMFAYGWTFQMGFINYYLSIGLAFFALAVLHRGRGAERLLAVALGPLIWSAHPLGLALLAAAGAYVLLAARLSPRRQLLLLAAGALAIAGARLYLSTHYRIAWRAGVPVVEDGADQLFLYGLRYRWLSRLFEALTAGFLVFDLVRSGRIKEWARYFLPAQLYVLALLVAILVPSVVLLPQYDAPLGLLTERFTSVSAVLLCCLLGLMTPRRWHVPGFTALALLFALFLYQDTGTLNRMEAQVEQYVHLIPPGQRVLATIWRFPGSRVFIQHIVDRACVGQCFSYENYEPSSKQFRVRADAGNPYTLTARDSDAAQGGGYVVQPQDVPVFEIYQCNLDMVQLCMRELAVGEENGAVGVHPSR